MKNNMEAEQLLEWRVLERQATEKLRTGNAPDRAGVRQLFQVLVRPSFAPYTGWEVYQDVKVAAGGHFVVHSVWRSDTDAAKLETPVVRLRHPRPLTPTIEVRHITVNAAWIKSVVAALEEISIPALVQLDFAGCDGTSYEVAFDALFVSARYGWWEEPPAGWRLLDKWARRVVQELEHFVAEG